MPNIVDQRVDENGIYIKVGTGAEVTITTAEILANYQSQIGTVPARRLLTREWIKDRIDHYCGADQIGYTNIDVDFDENTGIPTLLITGGLFDD